MTKTDEILSAIRYAPGPIGIAAIYEKVRSVEDIKDLSATLSYLHKNGRVDRVEITTPSNRKSFAYTMPERKTAEAADAAQAAPAAPAAQAIVPAVAPAEAAAAAEPAPARRNPGRKPKQQVEQPIWDTYPAPQDNPLSTLRSTGGEALSWKIDQAGGLSCSMGTSRVELTPLQARVMANMVLSTHAVLDALEAA